MNPESIRRILEELAAGGCTVADALERLKHWPVEDLGFARVDHHRHLRRGFPEVVFAERKAAAETLHIAEAIVGGGSPLFVTRADAGTLAMLETRFPAGRVNPAARTFLLSPANGKGEGLVVVLSAGTSDRPVAEEAAETSRAIGAQVESYWDVGVAGLHRLWPHLDRLRAAHAIVVVAGMEGALPSVVAGLVQAVVIGVPTSVGYGASFGGVAALLAMLNSCASGVVVVNIDNGFGAGFAAGLVNRAVVAAQPGARS